MRCYVPHVVIIPGISSCIFQLIAIASDESFVLTRANISDLLTAAETIARISCRHPPPQVSKALNIERNFIVCNDTVRKFSS